MKPSLRHIRVAIAKLAPDDPGAFRIGLGICPQARSHLRKGLGLAQAHLVQIAAGPAEMDVSVDKAGHDEPALQVHDVGG